jgi:hypothetical protein
LFGGGARLRLSVLDASVSGAFEGGLVVQGLVDVVSALSDGQGSICTGNNPGSDASTGL